MRFVDRDRIALSNQFFSKTARNLAENPRASVLVIDPLTFDEFRLTLAYERTKNVVRSSTNCARISKRSRPSAGQPTCSSCGPPTSIASSHSTPCRAPWIRRPMIARLARRTAGRLVGRAHDPAARCADLDTLVATTVDGLAELFDYQHSALMLLDETGTRLYTIASHGYQEEGVGSEVVVGEGIVGMAAARGRPIRLGNLRQLQKYANTVRAMSEDRANRANEIPVPVMPIAESRIAIPAMAFGQSWGCWSWKATGPLRLTTTTKEPSP